MRIKLYTERRTLNKWDLDSVNTYDQTSVLSGTSLPDARRIRHGDDISGGYGAAYCSYERGLGVHKHVCSCMQLPANIQILEGLSRTVRYSQV